METEQEIQIEQPVSPAGEVVSPSQPAETVMTEAPAASTEETELAAAQAAIEQAKTPEDKERARDGYQRRKEAKEYRETQERARTLELENARLKGRMEGMGPVQQAQPVQIQEPQIPAPAMPPRPDSSQWEAIEDYEAQQEKKFELLADWKAQCRLIEYQHEQTVERLKADNIRQVEQGQALVNDIIHAHPDFAEKMNYHRPSQAVGESIGVLATIDKKAAIETAYYLVSNPAELQRINQMHPEMARIALGQLAARLPATPPAKTTTNALPPINPITPASQTAEIDLAKLETGEFIEEMNRREFGE